MIRVRDRRADLVSRLAIHGPLLGGLVAAAIVLAPPLASPLGAAVGMAVGTAVGTADGTTLGPSMAAIAPAVPERAAQEETTQADRDATEARRRVGAEAISRLRSPFCPGQMLEVCSSAQGAAYRDSIRTWAQEGQSADSIVEAFIAQFGEEYRALPKASGRGLLAWLAPPVIFLLGLVAVTVALRRLRAGAPPPATSVSAEEEARVRAALAELERAEGPLV